MGLLDQARAAPPADDEAAEAQAGAPDNEATEQQPSDDGDTGETPNVSPEEQAQYDEFVKNGLRVIYDGAKPREEVINRLSQHPDDPIGTLANVTVWLVTMVESSAESNGAQISDDVKMHGAVELLEELGEVAGAAKIHDYTEKDLNAALLQAADLYRESGTASGKIDPEQLKQQFQQIIAADKAGDIQSVLPQIKNGPPGAPADPPADEQTPPVNGGQA